MPTTRRLIFGGSFDPIHHGHLFIAELAARHIQAERVIFLPTNRAPHRAPLSASVEHRLAMLRLAIAPNPRFILDESDVDRAATGYTVDVLPRVHARYPAAPLSFLVGEDALTKSHWYRFDDVVAQLEKLLIAPRDTDDAVEGQALSTLFAALAPATRERIELLPSPRITISATAIRHRISQGQTVRYLVPDPVSQYIEENALYQFHEDS